MAKNANGASYYEIRIDNAQLRVDAKQAESILAGIGNQAVAEGARIDNTFRKLILPAGVAIAAQQFARSLVQVRGEMKALEDSFEVLLSGKGVEGFISQLKQFAVDSPLSLPGVSNAAQTLLGFNVEAERVIPIIRQLGDVSMGNEEKFRSLALAYAQVHSTGKLMGQDLLQMINAGFNPLTVIAEKTGKSVGVLKEEMAAGAISAQMVADAFTAATAEGGKFYGMTQTQAEGIKGLEAQLEGAFQEAFNNIGKSQEGIITGSYKAAIAIVENYEKVGKIILGLVATYGAYKAAVIVATAAEKGWTVAQIAHYNVLLIVEKAQKLLNKTMLANPYVLLTMAVVALVGTMWALHDSTTAAEKAQKAHNDRLGEAKAKFDELISVVRDETKAITDRQEALENLRKLYPALFGDMDIEAVKLANLANLTKQATLAELDRERVIAENRIRELDTEIATQQGKATSPVNGAMGRAVARNRLKELEDEKNAQKDIVQAYYDQLDKEAELRRRAEEEAAKSPIYSKALEAARKDWETAKKDLAKIEKDKDKFTGEQYTKAKERVETAKKAFADLGGIVSTGGNAKNASEEYKKLVTKLADDEAQARIDAMADGLNKELEQNKLDYDRRIAQINEEEARLAKAKSDAGKGALTDAERGQFQTQRDTASKVQVKADTQARKAIWDAEVDSLNDYLIEYGNYEEKRLAITKKYDKLIAESKTLGEYKKYGKQRDKELQALERSAIEESEVWKRLFGDFSRISTESLLELFNQAQQCIDNATDLSAEDIKALQDRLNEARGEITKRNPFKALEDAYQKYQKAVKAGDKDSAFSAWSDVQNASQGIREQISELGNALSGFGDIFGDGIGDTIDKVVGSINSGIVAFEKFGKEGQKSAGDVIQGISGIIGIITTLIGGMINLIDQRAEKQARIQREIEEELRRQEGYWESINYQAEYHLELLNKMSGSDYFATQQEALDAYNKGLERASKLVLQIPKGEGENVFDSLLRNVIKNGGKLNSIYYGSLGTIIKDPNGDRKKTLAQLTDIYSLIEGFADGVDDVDIANAKVLKSNEELWAKMPKWLQDAINMVLEYEGKISELSEEIDKTLLQVTSSEMEDAFRDWLRSGKDATDEIGDYFGEVMRNALIESFVIDQLRPELQKFYDEYKRLSDNDGQDGLDLTSLEIADLNKRWQDIVSWAQTEADGLTSILENISTSTEDARTATAKGIASMSQDSADELNGRFTAIQGHTFSIMENQKLLLVNSNIALQHLSAISTNTHELHAMRADIAEMRNDIRTTRQTIGDIKDRGITLK